MFPLYILSLWTKIIKESDGTYKIKSQEVLREEESENDEGGSIFPGPSLLTQSNGQDLSQHRTKEYFENDDTFGILSENMDLHEETYTDPIDMVTDTTPLGTEEMFFSGRKRRVLNQ